MIPRVLFCLLALAGLGACGEDAPTPARAPEPPPEVREEPPASAQPEVPAEPPPLREAREVRIPTADVTLVGDLRVGDSISAPLVVLVHQLSSTRDEWEPLLRHLGADPALTTFALDMRGHGASTERARGGATLDWQSFQTRQWEAVADDLRAALGHLREEEGLQPSRVALVGSSIGSSAVIRAAAEDESVDALVALSPGRAYRGVDALTPLPQLGERPFFVVASRGEAPSAETAQDMARIAGGGELLLVDGDRHGVAMFEASPDALTRVATFLREQLAGAAPAPEEAPPTEEGQ